MQKYINLPILREIEKMKYIGAHVSITGGVNTAPKKAHEIGARAFAIFTGYSNRWKTPMPKPDVIADFKEKCALYGYLPHLILPHGNFLINLGSPDDQKLRMSRDSFLGELKRCEALGLTMLNFHPGSHLNLITPEESLDKIADSINWALDKTSSVAAVLENTAGQGSNLGHDLHQLAYIIDKVEDKTRIGVCIDTCHAYSAGYDMASSEGYERFWDDFSSIIGMQYLKGMHINDDLRTLGSRIDRHASIGQGTMGRDFFKRLVNDKRLDDIPLILETPDETLWPEEIAWLTQQENN